jgi:hypothetical protein
MPICYLKSRYWGAHLLNFIYHEIIRHAFSVIVKPPPVKTWSFVDVHIDVWLHMYDPSMQVANWFFCTFVKQIMLYGSRIGPTCLCNQGEGGFQGILVNFISNHKAIRSCRRSPRLQILCMHYHANIYKQLVVVLQGQSL